MNLLCPNCQKMLTVPEQYAGQLMKCPLCSGTFTVPALPSGGQGYEAAPPAPAGPTPATPPATAPLTPAPAPAGGSDFYGLSPEPEPAHGPPAGTPPAPLPLADLQPDRHAPDRITS